MRTRATLIRLLVALALAFPIPVAFGNPLAPIPPGSHDNPSLIAFDALQRELGVPCPGGSGTCFPEREGTEAFFVRDQMIMALLYLSRSTPALDPAGTNLPKAVELWRTANASYHAVDQYYDVTLTATSNCIQLEANAWALRTTEQLAVRTKNPAYETQAAQLAQTLTAVLQTGKSGATLVCSFVPAQVPLPLLALLEHYERTPSPEVRDAVNARLRHEITTHYNGGFHDGSGLVDLRSNAQYLLVLGFASDLLSSTEYASTRDGLASFLATKAVLSEGPDVFGRSLQIVDNATHRPVGTPDPSAQVWLAYAVYDQRQVSPESIPFGLPERLVESLVNRFWSHSLNGLVTEGGLLNTEPNALAALFTSGPALGAVAQELPRLSFAVPSERHFAFPPVGGSEAAKLLLSNEWPMRFTLQGGGLARQVVLLSGATFGPLNLSFPPSRYTPAVTLLQRNGEPIALETMGTPWPLLRFEDIVATPTTYLFTAYAPIVPVFADVLPLSSQTLTELSFQLSYTEQADLTIGTLTVDLAVRNVTFNAIRWNDEVLPAATYTHFGEVTTEFLPERHLRIQFVDLPLRPNATNELRFVLNDVERPTVSSVVIAHDPEGNQPIEPQDDVYKLGPRETGYVVARVTDNVVTDAVKLRVRSSSDASDTTILMTRSLSDPDLYVAPLPDIPGDSGTLQVLAVDQQVNLQDQTPLFAVRVGGTEIPRGNVVILVFAATLFFSAVVIYFKMGRKRKPL